MMGEATNKGHSPMTIDHSAPFEQVLKVRSDEWDGDDDGNEWQVHYVLYRAAGDPGADDENLTCYDLYSDDGKGNGEMICRGYHLGSMRSLALKLGELVEWQRGTTPL
jgi:hypothetical protein